MNSITRLDGLSRKIISRNYSQGMKLTTDF
jgi:hypothetical protein